MHVFSILREVIFILLKNYPLYPTTVAFSQTTIVELPRTLSVNSYEISLKKKIEKVLLTLSADGRFSSEE